MQHEVMQDMLLHIVSKSADIGRKHNATSDNV